MLYAQITSLADGKEQPLDPRPIKQSDIPGLIAAAEQMSEVFPVVLTIQWQKDSLPQEPHAQANNSDDTPDVVTPLTDETASPDGEFIDSTEPHVIEKEPRVTEAVKGQSAPKVTGVHKGKTNRAIASPGACVGCRNVTMLDNQPCCAVTGKQLTVDSERCDNFVETK